MKEYTFHYGRGTKRFSLDENKVIKEIRMPETPVMEDIPQGVLDAIYHPIGTEPIDKLIKPGQTVTFICNDPTRVANSFDFMPVLVNELNKLGIPDENMQIVFSLGTHRLMTHEEMVEGVGAEVASRLKMFNSDAKIAEDFEYFGATSRFTPVLINKRICHSDHIILTGTIVGNRAPQPQLHAGSGVGHRQNGRQSRVRRPDGRGGPVGGGHEEEGHQRVPVQCDPGRGASLPAHVRRGLHRGP